MTTMRISMTMSRMNSRKEKNACKVKIRKCVKGRRWPSLLFCPVHCGALQLHDVQQMENAKNQ